MRAQRPTLVRDARRIGLNPDDAEDAVQRAAEILLGKGPLEADPSMLFAWSRTVLRHEAYAIHRRRVGEPGPRIDTADPDDQVAALSDPAEVVERAERTRLAAAILARLKPAERRALGLQAAGCSYAEIGAITGWTYTKVNRCLREGRSALREVLGREQMSL